MKIPGIAFIYVSTLLTILSAGCTDKYGSSILDERHFQHYIENFNRIDDELYKQHIPNDSALSFLAENIPLVDLPDKDIEETYYFRWWTFRKHIKQTADGFVLTEFLPKVSWSRKHNTINCPAAHHIYEGRWLRDPAYIQDYIDFWLHASEDGLRQYSFWIADAVKAFHSLHRNDAILSAQLPLLVDNYEKWEQSRKDSAKTLFWQYDNYDGMELTVSGRLLNDGVPIFSMPAVRPSINSYMYGDAKAIAAIAAYVEDEITQQSFDKRAELIKQEVQHRLWNKELNFFSSLPRKYEHTTSPVQVRELVGYIPWYFALPDDDVMYAHAWNVLMDTTGFFAPYGLTTCERSHSFFEIAYSGHECQWNGPSWPFATTQTLKALSNVLVRYTNHGNVSKEDYYTLLLQYATSHSILNEKGKPQKWIDENLNPFTGDWISRTRLKSWSQGTWSEDKGGKERGKDYNHSGFCDLVISDLIGFKPSMDKVIEIHPLIPEDWEWFCLDRLLYHGKEITVVWDKSGKRYQRGKGFMIFVNGKLSKKTDQLEKIRIELPE